MVFISFSQAASISQEYYEWFVPATPMLHTTTEILCGVLLKLLSEHVYSITSILSFIPIIPGCSGETGGDPEELSLVSVKAECHCHNQTNEGETFVSCSC